MECKKIVVLFAVLLLLGIILDLTETSILNENRIQKLPSGSAPEEITLNLDADELLEGYDYKLLLEEELPDEKRRQELLAQAKEEIDQSFCQKGEELSHVTGRVFPAEEYADGLVQASWLFSDSEIIDYEGILMDERIPKEGIVVGASVELRCYESTQSYEFSFMAYPSEKTETEQLLADIDSNIRKQFEREGESDLVLPEELDGISLTWSGIKSHYAVKVMFLEVLVAVGLAVAEKENQKRKWKETQERMQLDYPEIVSKILILCGAGMSIKQAWHKISASYLNKRNKNYIRPAYEEMVRTDREMADGVSERIAVQQFGERIPLSSYHRFSRLLVENMQKGAKGMDRRLKQESEEAFEGRKRMARKLGEEAGTKMMAPMMIMLMIILAIIMVPAVISF